MANLISEGMYAVTHTWSSSDGGKSWKHRGEHDSSDEATDVAMTRVGKEDGYHAIGTKKKALYYVDHHGRTHGINEAALEVPHDRKFSGKKKTPVDVKPTLKSSTEQYGNKSTNVRESATALDTPKKMKYIGPSDSALTQGQTVYALTSKMIGGGVKVDTGKHRIVVHHHHLVDEDVQIDELSYKTLSNYAAKARSNIAHRKYLKYGEPDKTAEHDHKIAKHEEGIKVAKEKTKPPIHGAANVKIKNSESEAAKRKIADMDAKLSKTVRPSSNAIKDALGKMPAAAQRIADLRNKKTKMSEENILEISKEEMRAMAIAAAQKVQVTKVPAGASSDISSHKWKKAMQNGGKVAATKAVIHDPEEFNPSATFKGTNAHRKHVREDAEQIDELSRKKLGDYVLKADRQRSRSSHAVGYEDGLKDMGFNRGQDNHIKYHENRREQRATGIAKAIGKMTGSYPTKVPASEETVTETNRPSHHNPTVLVTFKGNKGAGGVKRIPKSEYDPKIHSLVEWVSKEQLAANSKARVDKFIEKGAQVKKIMDKEHEKYGVKKYEPKNTKEEVSEGFKEKISGIIRREKAKEYPLLQNRRDYAALRAMDASSAGDHRKSDRYMKWAAKNFDADKSPKFVTTNPYKPVKEEHQFISDLRLAIESNGSHPVTFTDGKRAAISPGYADLILAKYETISEESKRDEFVSTISSNLKTLRESIKR